MTIFRIFAILLLLAAGTAGAQQVPPEAHVTPLMTKALADYPGKDAVVITVDYLPGGESPLHRHNAHAFVYVLEGEFVLVTDAGRETVQG